MLPQKWCIKRDKSNRYIINKWADSVEDSGYTYSAGDGYVYSEKVSKGGHQHSDTDKITIGKHEDFTEITFEQFKQWVLAIPVTLNYEIC